MGTRLRPAVADRPKVLADVNGRPFVTHLLDRLEASGVQHTVLCTGFLAEQVKQALGPAHGRMALAYSRETQPLGTGGALRLAADLSQEETVWVLNGDSLATIDLALLAAFHQAHCASATLALVRVAEVARYGSVETDPDGRIRSFIEKGAVEGPGWVNAGVYIVRRQHLLAQAADRPVSLERETFPAWAGRLPFYACRAPGALLDIGTPESYAQAGEFLARATAGLAAP
jgi:NDP-sugar pyrophosphorylase family protein